MTLDSPDPFLEFYWIIFSDCRNILGPMLAPDEKILNDFQLQSGLQDVVSLCS